MCNRRLSGFLWLVASEGLASSALQATTGGTTQERSIGSEMMTYSHQINGETWIGSFSEQKVGQV
jgi:hypothetical protein